MAMVLTGVGAVMFVAGLVWLLSGRHQTRCPNCGAASTPAVHAKPRRALADRCAPLPALRRDDPGKMNLPAPGRTPGRLAFIPLSCYTDFRLQRFGGAIMNYDVLLWDVDGTLLDFLAAEKAAVNPVRRIRPRRVHRRHDRALLGDKQALLGGSRARRAVKARSSSCAVSRISSPSTA